MLPRDSIAFIFDSRSNPLQRPVSAWVDGNQAGHLSRFVVFGSFVTDKLEPADVDVFLLMEDTFDASQLTGEARYLFEHSAAQTRFGASVFWLRRVAAWEGEAATIDFWQVKRGGSLRGIIEIVSEGP